MFSKRNKETRFCYGVGRAMGLPVVGDFRALERLRFAAYLTLAWLSVISRSAASSAPDSIALGAPIGGCMLADIVTGSAVANRNRIHGVCLVAAASCGDGGTSCAAAPTALLLLQQALEHQSAGHVVHRIAGGAFTASSGASGPASGSVSNTASAWPEIRRVLKRCLQRAGSGGLPGAAAGLLQVATLMWLRTVVNYQCRYGTSMAAAARELYRQGGVVRFYRGVSFAILSNPLSRFGMAAANEGATALTDAFPRPVSVTFTTWIASLLAGVWRVCLTPLDTCKTVLQVEGPRGFALLMKKVSSGNLSCLYQGATAAAAATAVGYFPWFLTFNYLNGRLKKPSVMAYMLLRNAGIGLAASISSDMCSNPIRVLKTTKQSAAAYDAEVTYRGAAALVIKADGWLGLFGRGLTTRILANGLQSMLFTVVWRYLHDTYVVPRRAAAESLEGTDNGLLRSGRNNSSSSGSGSNFDASSGTRGGGGSDAARGLRGGSAGTLWRRNCDHDLAIMLQ